MTKKGNSAGNVHQKPAPANKKRTNLPENDNWAVFTEDKDLQKIILGLLRKNGWVTEDISIRARIVPVVFIPFSVAKKIMEIGEAHPLRVLFHRTTMSLNLTPRKHKPWKISKEGKTTLNPYYHECFPTWKRYW